MTNMYGALFLDLYNRVLKESGRTARIEQKFTWFPPCHKFIVKDRGKIIYQSYCPAKTRIFVNGYVEGWKKR